MSAISLKSITGITSITTPAGVDNQLTLHNNNTTEAVKLDIAGNLHFHNHLNITGVSTASNFKTGTSNLHNTGLNVFDLDVDGHTNLDNVSIAGVTTMTGNLSMGETLTISGNNPNVTFTDTNSNPDYKIYGSNGAFTILDSTNGVNRFAISSTGNISLSNDLDVDGHTNLDNVSIAGVTTFTGQARFSGELVAESVISVQSGGSINIPDKLIHSGDADTAIRFPAVNTISMETAGSERLRIMSDGEIRINHTQSSTPLNNTFISIWDANSDSSAIDASGVSKNYAMISLHNYGTGNPGDTTGIGFGAGSGFSYTKGSIAFTRSGSYGTGDLVFLTNNDQNTTMVNDTDEKLRITRDSKIIFSDCDVSIGRDAALANYADGSNTPTQLAVVKDGGSAGSGYHEVAHFTAGTDSNDTGAIVRITQFNNDRGLYIKAGRGTLDQAKAIFGLRNSSAGEADVMTFLQGGVVGINNGSPTQGQLVVSNSSGNTIAALKTGNAGAVALGGPTQPRILMEAGQSSSDLLIYTAGGSSWGSPSWSEKFRLLDDGGLKLSNTGSGNLFEYGGSTVNANAAININRYGNGYADIRLSSNYGASIVFAGAGDNTDEYRIQQDNQKNAYHNLEYDGFINFVTNNNTQACRMGSGKVSINKNLETLTGNGFAAALQVNNRTTDGYGTIMMGGAYNRATIGIGNVYDLILTSNAYPANASTGGIKFRCGSSGGGGPTQRFRIHQDGMLDTKQEGTAKTYWFSSGRSGGYSSLTITIDAHAYHSFVITVAHAGYAGSWTTSKFMGYENGTMYYGNEGTETTDSNSRNVTHDQNPGGGHIHRIRITGGMGTHPVCELRITIGGPDAYIDTGDVAFTWS